MPLGLRVKLHLSVQLHAFLGLEVQFHASSGLAVELHTSLCSLGWYVGLRFCLRPKLHVSLREIEASCTPWPESENSRTS